jgi:hypothetical protein
MIAVCGYNRDRGKTLMQNIAVQNPPISRLLRIITFIEIIVLLIAGGGLFFVPQLAGTVWSWTLTPFNAGFLGAVYIASLTSVALMGYIARWSPARGVLWVIFVFTFIVLAVSIGYFFRFNLQSWSAWLWYGLYVLLPLSSGYHLWLYRKVSDTHLSPLPSRWSNMMRVVGVLFIGYGLGLLVVPNTFSLLFPWLLDDFHSRLYSSAFISMGIGLLITAKKTDAWELIAVGLPMAVLGVLAVVGLLMVDASLQRIVWTEIRTWAWIATCVLTTIFALLLIVMGWRRLRLQK